MTLSQSVRSVLSKYATFTGRATRSEFWYWILFVFIVSLVVQLLDGVIIGPLLGFAPFASDAGDPLSMLVGLVFFIPNIAVAARRLHDIGRSGWWQLLIFVPLIGFIVLIYWYVQPSQEDQNQFG